MVLFTRRLETREEEFDGVVLMAIDARYFTSFVSPATIGAGGIVALASGRFSMGQIAIPVGVGVGAGTGIPIVTSTVTATI